VNPRREQIAPALRLVYDAATVNRYIAEPSREPRAPAWTDLLYHQGQGCRNPRDMAAEIVGVASVLADGSETDETSNGVQS